MTWNPVFFSERSQKLTGQSPAKDEQFINNFNNTTIVGKMIEKRIASITGDDPRLVKEITEFLNKLNNICVTDAAQISISKNDAQPSKSQVEADSISSSNELTL